MLDSNKEREVEFDLVWYWCHSQADCGIKSNYMSMINVACYGPSTTFQDPFNTFILNSVAHRHKIEEILYLIPFKQQKILYASFADLQFSPQIELIFNKLTGAVYLNSYIPIAELDKICRNFHLGNASDKDKALISSIRMEATTNYFLAIASYLQAKRKFGRSQSRKNKI
jgi:hypothetical protein